MTTLKPQRFKLNHYQIETACRAIKTLNWEQLYPEKYAAVATYLSLYEMQPTDEQIETYLKTYGVSEELFSERVKLGKAVIETFDITRNYCPRQSVNTLIHSDEEIQIYIKDAVNRSRKCEKDRLYAEYVLLHYPEMFEVDEEGDCVRRYDASLDLDFIHRYGIESSLREKLPVCYDVLQRFHIKKEAKRDIITEQGISRGMLDYRLKKGEHALRTIIRSYMHEEFHRHLDVSLISASVLTARLTEMLKPLTTREN